MIDQILYPTVSILEMVETWDVMIHIYIYIMGISCDVMETMEI
jgi:hypothetical protein